MNLVRVEDRMNTSAFCDYFMGLSDVLKVLKTERAICACIWAFRNITSDHE